MTVPERNTDVALRELDSLSSGLNIKSLVLLNNFESVVVKDVRQPRRKADVLRNVITLKATE